MAPADESAYRSVMSTTSRRKPAPRSKPLPPEPEPEPAKPVPPAGPASAGTSVGIWPAAAEPARLCSFCNSRRPVSELGQVADSLQCADTDACLERAAVSGLYPMTESEQAIAVREALQGAIR
jgi:hypothetical protein